MGRFFGSSKKNMGFSILLYILNCCSAIGNALQLGGAPSLTRTTIVVSLMILGLPHTGSSERSVHFHIGDSC